MTSRHRELRKYWTEGDANSLRKKTKRPLPAPGKRPGAYLELAAYHLHGWLLDSNTHQAIQCLRRSKLVDDVDSRAITQLSAGKWSGLGSGLVLVEAVRVLDRANAEINQTDDLLGLLDEAEQCLLGVSDRRSRIEWVAAQVGLAELNAVRARLEWSSGRWDDAEWTINRERDRINKFIEAREASDPLGGLYRGLSNLDELYAIMEWNDGHMHDRARRRALRSIVLLQRVGGAQDDVRLARALLTASRIEGSYSTRRWVWSKGLALEAVEILWKMRVSRGKESSDHLPHPLYYVAASQHLRTLFRSGATLNAEDRKQLKRLDIKNIRGFDRADIPNALRALDKSVKEECLQDDVSDRARGEIALTEAWIRQRQARANHEVGRWEQLEQFAKSKLTLNLLPRIRDELKIVRAISGIQMLRLGTDHASDRASNRAGNILEDLTKVYERALRDRRTRIRIRAALALAEFHLGPTVPALKDDQLPERGEILLEESRSALRTVSSTFLNEELVRLEAQLNREQLLLNLGTDSSYARALEMFHDEYFLRLYQRLLASSTRPFRSAPDLKAKMVALAKATAERGIGSAWEAWYRRFRPPKAKRRPRSRRGS